MTLRAALRATMALAVAMVAGVLPAAAQTAKPPGGAVFVVLPGASATAATVALQMPSGVPIPIGVLNPTTGLFAPSGLGAVQSGLASEIATARANEALLAPLASPAFSGLPTAPTAAPKTASGVLATTAYSDAATAAEAAIARLAEQANASAITSEAGRAQATEALLAPLASPALTGTPTAPTASPKTASTAIATTAYADAATAAEAAIARLAEQANATAAGNAFAAARASLQPGNTFSEILALGAGAQATARGNLGLGGLSILSTIAGLDGSGTAVKASGYPATGVTSSTTLGQFLNQFIYLKAGFGAVCDDVADDTNAINTAFAQARLRTSGNGYTGITSQASTTKLVWPDTMCRTTGTVNATNLQSLNFFVEGNGGGIDAQVNGVPAIDALGARWLRWNNFVVNGNRNFTTTYGIQTGRITQNGNADDNRWDNITFTGTFQKACLYVRAAEDTVFSYPICYNGAAPAGAYGYVLDGMNHFGVTSQFVTVTAPVDVSESFNEFMMIQPDVQTSNAVPYWIGGTSRLKIIDGYEATGQPNAVTLYSSASMPITQADIDLHTEMNQSISDDVFLLDGPGGSFTGSISGTTLTVTALSGNLLVGESLTGTGGTALVAGTTITAVGSGNPAVCSTSTPCTFTVSQSQTVASETMTGVTPQASLRGFRHKDHYPQPTNSMFKLSGNVQSAFMSDLDLDIGTYLNSAAKVFDAPSAWTVSGDYHQTAGTSAWNYPAAFSGRFCIGSQCYSSNLVINNQNNLLYLTAPVGDPGHSLGLGTASATYPLGPLGRATGLFNVCVGDTNCVQSGNFSYVTALGPQALPNITSGGNDMAIGYNAMLGCTTCGQDVAIGSSALKANVSGNKIIAIGDHAAPFLTAGSNIAIATNSNLTTGTGNIVIGIDPTKTTPAGNNQLDIGDTLTGTLATGGANNGVLAIAGSLSAVSYSETLATPASSSAACAAGQFGDDANYHYVCTATNTWKRAALTAF